MFQDIDGSGTPRLLIKSFDNKYRWTERQYPFYNMEEKLEYLIENIGDNGNTKFQFFYKQGYSLLKDLKDQYLLLKNRNKDNNKKSFQLFIETVSNVYNSWMQYIEKN